LEVLTNIIAMQLQHDYILGNYPVGRDDAAQLSALQILVEIGFVDNPESCVEWISLLERFLPRQVAITRAKRDWELDIVSRYQLMVFTYLYNFMIPHKLDLIILCLFNL
jgi:hypothetical protein